MPVLLTAAAASSRDHLCWELVSRVVTYYRHPGLRKCTGHFAQQFLLRVSWSVSKLDWGLGRVRVFSHGLDYTIPQWENGLWKDTYSPSHVLGIPSSFWLVLAMWATCLPFPSRKEFPFPFLLNSHGPSWKICFIVWLSTHYFASYKWMKHVGKASSHPSWKKRVCKFLKMQ